VKWDFSDVKLQKQLRVSVDGRIPDDARGMLQVDFANKYVGGGMLGEGCVQEEILFMLYPELIVSRLFTEELLPNETLIITGCERFNNSDGYASSFRWTGDYVEDGNRDLWGRLPFEIVAMDAMVLMISDTFLDRASSGIGYTEINVAEKMIRLL
jgi:poly(ADP-ribose) glycohydrolase